MCDTFEIKIADGKAAIYTPYNAEFVSRIKLLGGRWNSSEKCWTVAEFKVDDVRSAMRSIYGRDDQPVAETVDVILTFTAEVSVWHAPVTILGRTIATAWGRDSGARMGDDVMFLEGKPESGGSVKNWHTIVPAGSVVKLPELPKTATEECDLPNGVTMQIIGEDIDREALLSEREKLLARLAEIDAILAGGGGKTEDTANAVPSVEHWPSCSSVSELI